MKISAVYKIINTVTGDFYVGSSKDVKRRWMQHKRPSTWNKCKNNPLYLDMKKYGLDKFSFQILAEVEIGQLKETEQRFIEKLQPIYNNYNAKGLNVKRYKEYNKEYGKEYRKTDKCKEYQKKYNKEYRKTDKCKEYQQQYQKKYEYQLCYFNGETLTLQTLRKRFSKAGIEHPVIEAKKYLLGGDDD